jgi:hypothetical protein
MIEKFLNNIKKEEDGSFIFYGDGVGDFEIINTLCSKEVLQNYIKYLGNQINLAYEVLNKNG